MIRIGLFLSFCLSLHYYHSVVVVIIIILNLGRYIPEEGKINEEN